MVPLYLIDGFNFLHAVVLEGKDRAEWWSPANKAAVVGWVERRFDGAAAEVWVVFDQRGAPSSWHETAPGASGEGVRICHAPDADELIVARCAELGRSRDVVVVSADRSLVDRAKHRGARALSPWALAGYRGGGLGRGSPEASDVSEDRMDETAREERFVRLEEKAAYLERLAQDLNDVVITQGQLIDDLFARLDRLERQQRAGEDDEVIPHERPPHY